MSVITNQPLPFGRLERERHIQTIFRAFQNRCHSPEHRLHQTPADWEPEEQVEEWRPGGPAGSDFRSMLETVSQIHVAARPELQGIKYMCICVLLLLSQTGLDVSLLSESSCVCLQCCGPARACTLRGFDCQGRQVFYFERPLRVDACCLGCCLMEIKAFTPQKHLIGTVCQRWSMFTPLLDVCDAEGTSTLRIQGPCCPCRCLSNQQFQIVSNIGEKIGTIWKKWPGFNDEQNMDHEYFGMDGESISGNVLCEMVLIKQMFFFLSCSPLKAK
uniref:Phospholipid scramblase n=1 Tax=Anabas testudineus TaxID=64144 RepID=A0A7N6BYX3_ANATE